MRMSELNRSVIVLRVEIHTEFTKIRHTIQYGVQISIDSGLRYGILLDEKILSNGSIHDTDLKRQNPNEDFAAPLVPTNIPQIERFSSF